MSCCKSAFVLCEPVPCCLNQLLIKTPVASQDLNIRVLDKFNRIYYVEKTSDASGFVTLQLVEDDSNLLSIVPADLPLSLLNEYAGWFRVMVYDTSGNLKQWTLSSIQYDAIQFEVKKITPDQTTYSIDPTLAEGQQQTFSEL